MTQTTQTSAASTEPIAIVGIGCRFPGNVDDPRSYWDLLVNGVDAVSEIPRDRLDLLTYHSPDHATPGTFISRWGGFVRHIDQFSPEFFAISPREAASMDPQQRLMLEVAWRALEDAGQIPHALAGTDTGVFVGISTHDFSDIKFSANNRRLIDAHTATGGALSIAANRISYVLDLRGPSMAVDTACSSSLVAVHQACQAIRHRECSVAIAGGVNLLLCAEPFIGFSKASMLSPDGRCKAFDEQANGYVRAEGAGAIILKPLSRAVADGDDIYCVIIGSAVNQDGHSKGLTVPNGASQEALIETACAAAGITPIDIQYVEAHGTGTPVGDPIEANAVGGVLSRNRPADRPCLIGSAKTNLGHLEAASGMAGLIKVALSLQRRTIPANLHFRRANPDIDMQRLRLQVPTRTQAWPAAPDERAIASVNSFGFGGTNAHVIAAEAPPMAETAHDEVNEGVERPYVLPISARGEKELHALAASYVERLAETACESTSALRDLCYTAAVRLSHHDHRLALVAGTGDEAIESLNQFMANEPSRSLSSGRVVPHERPKLAFVFSGMGPQWYAMGRELLCSEPVFRSVIEACDALLRRHVDWSLLDEMLADETRSRMEDADVAQPANFALQTALAALLRSWGVEPHAVIGHSAGEVAAIHVAGAMTLEQAIHVIVHRSRLQHRTSGQGNMVAVHLTPADAQRLADEFMGDVTVGAINGPSDVTLSVTTGARDRLVQTCEQRAIHCRVLRGRVPYHSPMMDSIRQELLDALAPLRPQPTVVPFISTVTGQPIAGDVLDAAYWWHNVRDPVRFTNAVDGLLELGCNIFLEIGPHPTLAGFVSACLAHREKDGVVMPSLRRHEKEQSDLMGAIARLYTSGYPVDWRKLYPSGRHVRLPGYPWQRDTHWRESDESLRERINGTTHVLLGRPLGLAVPAWENHLDLTRLRYLRDHQVQDAIVMPAAAFVEMGLAAGSAVLPASAFVLEEMEFRKALFFTDGATPKVQLVCRPDGVGFDIFSNTPNAENAWMLHASGRLLPCADDRAHDSTVFESARQRCSEEVPARDCYDTLRKMGLQYGPGFQGIERLWRGNGEAFARVRTPGDGEPGEDAYSIHPALLDACFQVLIGAVGTTGAGEPNGRGVYLPVLIKQLRLHRRPAGPLYCTARVRKRTAKFLSGDICLWSAAGELLVKIAGFRCQRLAALQSAPAEDPVKESLYHFKWVAKDHARKSDVPLDLVTPAEIVDRLRTAPPVLTDREEDTVVQVQQQLDVLAGAYIRTAFRTLGFPSGGAFSEEELAAKLGVVPALRPFFGRYLSLLDGEGLVQREGGQWKVGPAPPAEDMSPLIERVRSTSPDVPELSLLERCGGHLAEVLQGRANPVELLFPGGSLSDAERVYGRSTAFRVYNLLIRDAVRMAVDRLPADRGIAVLEIGAGTGGTTAHVLPALPADRTRYVFSDLSVRFLQIAEDRFREHPGLETRILDIERDPEAQGFERHGFDVVIAADVLHTTRDLRSTIEHVKQLLAPQGLFVLLEVTSAPRWVDLVFGITEGWFRFTDASLRGSYPLLSRERWIGVLNEAGFPEVGAIVHDFEGLGSTQSVLVAQAPAAASTNRVLPDVDATGNWIILADSGHLSSGLAERIASSGGRPTFIHANAEGHHGRHGSHFTTDPGQPERMVSLLEEVFESLDDCRAIVHMWSVAAPALESVASLERAQALGGNSLVSILHAVSSRSWPSSPEFCVVTRGAQPADGSVACPAQAPVIGIGRVMRNEVPNLKTRMVDLDPVCRDDEVETLWQELWTDDGEEEIALRDRSRVVSRFSRLNLDEMLREKSGRTGDEAPPFRLEVVTPGALDTLSLRATERRPPGPGEVEVRVHAAGLNFRDVMLGMGLLVDAVQEGSYFGDALGMECAGTITAVGDHVRNVAVGDEVIAQGRGCFAAYMTTHADYVVRKPGHLTFEEAATIPVAFVTVYYALNRLSQLARGERILIHAAAGGVGLVAVMLAQRAGAEIFATAGSEEKRQFLRSLGVTHVMNSRTLAFADEIMEATDGTGVDVVLNSLSGEAIGKSMSILGPQGRFVEIGKTDIAQGRSLNLAPFANSLSYFAVDIDRILHARPTYAAALFQEAMAYFEREGLRPVHSTAYSLSDISTAFRDMAQARHIGKIVISMDDDTAWITRTDTARTIVRPDASYLITGGLGGFGLTVAKWLVHAGARHLVLMGRHAPPAHGPIAAEIDTLRDGGADVRIAEADVTREDDVHAVVARIGESMPPLRGVVHAAMVLNDGYLSQLGFDQMNRVLAPKATGAWNLHRHTLGCELDFFVLFSSVATMFGNPGQANYVAANVFLDAFAHYRRSLGLPGVSIRWGALSDVGYLARHAKLSQFLDQQGLKQFTPDDALRSLSSIIAADVPDVVAARMDWAKWSESYPRSAVSSRFSDFLRTIASQRTQESFVSVRESCLQLAPEQRHAFLMDYLAERIAKVLRMPKAKVSVDSPLTDHGLDSLMALELKTRVDRDLEVDVPMTALLQGPTLQQLAERLVRQVSAAPDDTPAPSAPRADDVGRLVTIQPYGEHPACFGIHPSSGKVGCYTELSAQLGPTQPFFGIEAAGFNGHAAATSTIEQIARAYIGLMRKVQPSGPYCLVGYSMGGAIAYEMAQQMRSEGESIRALVLIDTPSPSLGREADKLDDAQLIAWFVTELGMTLGCRLHASREEILPLDDAQRLSYIVDRTKELSIEGKHLSRERIARMLAVFKANVRAHIEYVPDAYPGEVTFFTADKEAPEYLEKHPDAGRLGYGWDRWVDSLIVKRIEGSTHHDILSETHARRLAVDLKEMLSGVASS